MNSTAAAGDGLFVLSAPSGGGKTSLARALLPRLRDYGIRAEISVSYTTRAPRPGEQDGVHYHFVDEAGFTGMIARDEFFEHAQVFGRRYGTGRVHTEKLLADGCDVILDIDWQGNRQVRERAPAARSIFLLPPSVAELERRLRGRGQDSAAAIAARMREAHDEMAHYAEYDYVIVNDSFEHALDQLAAIFAVRRLRLDGQALRHQALIAELLDKSTLIG